MPSSPEPLFTAGRYVALDKLATGGMATVYRGRLEGDGGFAKTVVLKKMHPHVAADPQAAKAFLQEARIGAHVSHFGVLPILDVVSHGGELLLVMEYVEGVTLQELRRDARTTGEPLGVDVVSAIIGGVLDGLHAAHEAEDEHGNALHIVHLDVSPTNVLVSKDGMARVLDFGIARVLGDLAEAPDARIAGKPAYLAPEQVLRRGVNRRADVWATSVMLWELLTGRRLFTGATMREVITGVVHSPIPLPSELRADVPDALDVVVMRGLERDPDERWASAKEMAAALEVAAPPASARTVAERIARVAIPRETELERTALVAEPTLLDAVLPPRTPEGEQAPRSKDPLARTVEHPTVATLTVRDLALFAEEMASARGERPSARPWVGLRKSFERRSVRPSDREAVAALAAEIPDDLAKTSRAPSAAAMAAAAMESAEETPVRDGNASSVAATKEAEGAPSEGPPSAPARPLALVMPKDRTSDPDTLRDARPRGVTGVAVRAHPSDEASDLPSVIVPAAEPPAVHADAASDPSAPLETASEAWPFASALPSESPLAVPSAPPTRAMARDPMASEASLLEHQLERKVHPALLAGAFFAVIAACSLLAFVLVMRGKAPSTPAASASPAEPASLTGDATTNGDRAPPPVAQAPEPVEPVVPAVPVALTEAEPPPTSKPVDSAAPPAAPRAHGREAHAKSAPAEASAPKATKPATATHHASSASTSSKTSATTTKATAKPAPSSKRPAPHKSRPGLYSRD